MPMVSNKASRDFLQYDHFLLLGNMEFYQGDLDIPGSYLDAVRGCEGVFIGALPDLTLK